MTDPDKIPQLEAKARKARALAYATTDPITLDILNNFARECEEQVRKLKSPPH